jgi:polyhydroxyalkanoate synthesis regulator phasin
METAAETKDEKDESRKSEYRSFHDMVRRMMLAGIGAIALKHDEIEEFMDKLVERGEIAKKDREELVREMRERYKKSHPGEEHPAHKKVIEFMERFSMPTKDDIDELNKKLTQLEKKIDELGKAKK